MACNQTHCTCTFCDGSSGVNARVDEYFANTQAHTDERSLSLSLSHTHTQCTCSLSLSPLSLSLSHTHTHTHTHNHTTPHHTTAPIYCGYIIIHTADMRLNELRVQHTHEKARRNTCQTPRSHGQHTAAQYRKRKAKTPR